MNSVFVLSTHTVKILPSGKLNMSQSSSCIPWAWTDLKQTIKTDEFALLDATAQAELVRNKGVKPIELVEAAIARIEQVNPEINAVVTPMYDLARTAAVGELPDGPFTGVPFLLKDLGATYAGVRPMLGCDIQRGPYS